MADCAVCSAVSWERTTAVLFRVREPSRVTAACGGRGSAPGELGRCPTDCGRSRPLRSGRSWPGCGPDVAPLVPSLEGASRHSAQPRCYREWQLTASRDCPLLSVRDRLGPMLRARGGHGRRGPTALQRGGDGHKLNRRVRPVRGDHCFVGKPAQTARQHATAMY